jgi:segregation and condensation protein B
MRQGKASGGGPGAFDRELADLPPALRWREWMRRIEAALLASARPVPRQALARAVGEGASVELLVADLRADLAERPYEVVAVAEGFLLRTRPAYAPAIRAAADLGEAPPDLAPWDVAVLAAIAYRQPIARDDLSRAFGREVSRELIGRLRARDLIAPGPRSPRPGAPYTFVTTEGFLATFDLGSLRDLPDVEMMGEAGLEKEG